MSDDEQQTLCSKCQRTSVCKLVRKDFVCVDREDCKQCLRECEEFRKALRAYVERRGL